MEELLRKNEEAENMIKLVTSQIEILKKHGVDVSISEDQGNQLKNENKELREKISLLKKELIKTELLNGEIQVDLPEVIISPRLEQVVEKKADPPKVTKQPVINTIKPSEPLENKSKGDRKAQPKSSEAPEVIDISRFDMRIGKILEVTKHAEADSLYVEKVDIGEDKPRQIISGLVKYCSESDLLGRMAVFLVNLKPAKMRGILSEGMIMCASAPEQNMVEPLLVPEGVKPGDRVTVEGFGSNPDEIMNPKKKILETVKPEMKVDENGIATYRGGRWQVNGQVGLIKSTNLKNVPIA